MSQLSLELDCPIDYHLVISPRAKRLTLRLEPGRGLIVTAPKRFPKRDIPEFVESHREWIEKSQAEIDRATPDIYRRWPPRQLKLQALSKTVELRFRECQDSYLSTVSPDLMVNGLTLNADVQDKVAVATEIAQYLTEQAQEFLPPRLARHAANHGLNYKKVQIRGQRSVWGSYSSSGTLSLNYKLLFLPEELVDYVLLHELAHTRYLDHSTKFWQCLESFIPGAKRLDKQMSKAGRDVPPWLEWAR